MQNLTELVQKPPRFNFPSASSTPYKNESNNLVVTRITTFIQRAKEEYQLLFASIFTYLLTVIFHNRRAGESEQN